MYESVYVLKFFYVMNFPYSSNLIISSPISLQIDVMTERLYYGEVTNTLMCQTVICRDSVHQYIFIGLSNK